MKKSSRKEKDPTRDPETQNSSSSSEDDRETRGDERTSSLEKRTGTGTAFSPSHGP